MRALVAILLVYFCGSVLAPGLGGPAGPGLSHRADLKGDALKQALALNEFMREELEFIEGSFINEYTNLRFGGEEAKVTEFLKKLQALGSKTVTIGIQDFGEKKTAFRLGENGATQTVAITINAGRPDFTLKAFAPWLPKAGSLYPAKPSIPVAE